MHRTGGCACGAIRYEFEGEPLFVHACHCTDCQRASGTAFGITMLVEARDFRVVSGEPGAAALTGGSGAAKQSFFCPQCGGWLFGRTELRPGVLAIRPRHPRRQDRDRAPGAYLDPEQACLAGAAGGRAAIRDHL